MACKYRVQRQNGVTRVGRGHRIAAVWHSDPTTLPTTTFTCWNDNIKTWSFVEIGCLFGYTFTSVMLLTEVTVTFQYWYTLRLPPIIQHNPFLGRATQKEDSTQKRLRSTIQKRFLQMTRIFSQTLSQMSRIISQYSAGCRMDTHNSNPSKDSTPLATGPRQVLQNRGGLLWRRISVMINCWFNP